VSGQRLRIGNVPRLRLPCALGCPTAVIGERQERVHHRPETEKKSAAALPPAAPSRLARVVRADLSRQALARKAREALPRRTATHE
jgi:hypothetical protein